jgi:NADPH:quinone reductase-like Zn-dependent oxidoreductase
MKCYTVNGRGLDGLVLQNIDEPAAPGSRDVLVEVHAVALNFRDLLVAKGAYGGTSEQPIIAGSDMAGVVLAVGSEVNEFKVGDRVLNAPFRFWPGGALQEEWTRTFIGGAGVDGILAEQILYPAESLVKMPTHMSFAEAATLTIAGLTAWAGVVTHGRTQLGEWVLLQGTGGVAIFGAQIAKALGARTIISTKSDAKAALVKSRLGVNETVNYMDEDWPDQVRKLTQGKGVDVILEVTGGKSLGQSLQAFAYGGRMAVIGILDSSTSTINVIDILRKQITIRGILMESTQELRRFVNACDAIKLQPWVDRIFPFNEARQAYAYLQSQQHLGKVVIHVR